MGCVVMKDISKLISQVTSPILKKKGLAFGTLLQDWDQLVPREYQGKLIPKSLSFPKGETKNAKLTLLVPNHSVALYCQYILPLLQQRINQHFGYPIIQNTALKTDPCAFSELPLPSLIKKKEDLKKILEPFDSQGLDPSLVLALENLQGSLH